MLTKTSIILFLNCLVIQLLTAQTLLDNFDRANTNTLGVPSGGAFNWLETEVTANQVRIQNSQLVFENNNPSGRTFASYDATNRYSTVFEQASGNLVWQCNMWQSRNNPSGFGTNDYGIAFVIGADESDFTSPTCDGYAVVLGNTGNPDPVRLVRFSGINNQTDVITNGSDFGNNILTVRVTYNPCTSQFALFVNDAGTSGTLPTTFTDPAVATYMQIGTSVTEDIFTGNNLNFIGALWNYNTASAQIATFDNIYLPNVAQANNTYTWNGSLNTDFQIAGNWTPTRTCSLSNDVLQFQTAGNISISNIPTQTIGRLSVSNGCTLTFSTLTSQTLTIRGVPLATDLEVTAGSTLLINSNASLELVLGTGATGSITGNMSFGGVGVDLNHRLLATDASAVVFNNGSIFTAASGVDGNVFGNSGTSNTVIFANGSRYVSTSGSNPYGLAQPGSKVTFQTGSTYIHRQASAPSLAGRTYANFEFDFLGTSTILFGSSLPTRLCTIDNLSVLQGVFNITLTNADPLPILLKNDLNISVGATFEYNPSDITDINQNTFTFGGNTAQTITNQGILVYGPSSTLIFDNSAGFTIAGGNVATTGNLTLNNGIINTGTNTLQLLKINTGALTGGSATAYVNGNLLRSIATLGTFYEFPIGDATRYQRMALQFSDIGICLPVLINAHFTDSDPRLGASTMTNFSEAGAFFTDILPQGFWQINTTCLNIIRYDLRLYPVGFADFPIGRAAYTIVKRPTGSTGTGIWQSNGTILFPALLPNEFSNGVFTPAGYISRTGMSNFSDFGIGASLVNPLPVNLVSFEGKTEGNSVKLHWKTTAEKNNLGFEVEKSIQGNNFAKIAFVKANPYASPENEYVFFDDNPQQMNYYRLKQIDTDGKFVYSKTIAVTSKTTFQVYPNPVSNSLQIDFLTDEEILLTFSDMFGRTLVSEKNQPKKCLQSINQLLPVLPAGIYLLEVRQQGQIFRKKIVKQ
ncbi:MAG: T9SS type A sorting domain-containing protein [Verrucomicrobia bacterium]|nr:T9SS type A sorting domain-containing protein [Cytophagales bacterium]